MWAESPFNFAIEKVNFPNFSSCTRVQLLNIGAFVPLSTLAHHAEVLPPKGLLVPAWWSSWPENFSSTFLHFFLFGSQVVKLTWERFLNFSPLFPLSVSDGNGGFWWREQVSLGLRGSIIVSARCFWNSHKNKYTKNVYEFGIFSTKFWGL